MKTNKYLFLLFIACLFATLCQGQNTRKSITDSIFQLDPANVLEHINKKVNLLGLDVPLRALPLTVTTLSSETLERKNIYELQDAVRFLPGVTVRDQLGAFYRFSIRGTNEEEAFKVLREAGLEPLTNTEEAVQRAVDIAAGRA